MSESPISTNRSVDARSPTPPALRAAVHDARTQAETIAGAAGGRLESIRKLTHASDEERKFTGGTVLHEAAPAADFEFDPTDITVKESVKIVWTVAPL